MGASCGDPGDEPEVKLPTRTIMVYMAAHNSLGDGSTGGRWDNADIKEMYRALVDNPQLDEQLNVIIYHAASDGSRTLKRLTARDSVTVIRDYGADAPSSLLPSTMESVLADMRAAAPADSYGLVMWSHASGWIFDPSREPSSRSWGVEKGGEMSIPKLAEVLEKQNFDFIYFDCCYMGNIETLYELRDVAPVIVASATETPLAGMPYDVNLPLLARLPDADCTGAARSTFEYYNSKSNAIDRSIAIAVYDMSKIGPVADAVRSIMAENRAVPSSYRPQRYGYGATYTNLFFDLHGYMHALAGDNTTLTDAFDSALDDFVTYHAETDMMWNALALTDCHGVSAYILPTEGYDYYANRYSYTSLAWNRDVVEPAAASKQTN